GDGAADLLEAHGANDRSGVPLRAVGALLETLASTSDRAERTRRLTEVLQQARPGEAAYLIKALLSELRIGVQLGILEEGIAAAFGRTLDELRKASALLDIGALVLAAHDGTLDRARPEVGVPVSFMLATPTESVK